MTERNLFVGLEARSAGAGVCSHCCCCCPCCLCVARKDKLFLRTCSFKNLSVVVCSGGISVDAPVIIIASLIDFAVFVSEDSDCSAHLLLSYLLCLAFNSHRHSCICFQGLLLLLHTCNHGRVFSCMLLRPATTSLFKACIIWGRHSNDGTNE